MPLDNWTIIAYAAAGLYIAHILTRRILARQRTNIHRLPSAPKDEATWLLGHELKIWEDDASEATTRWTESVGQVYRIHSAFRQEDMLYVGDLAAARHIFANVDTYVRPPYFRNHIANLLGRGLIWAEHDEHRMQRRLTGPAFSAESIRGMSDFVTDACEKLVAHLGDIVRAGENESAVVNISEYTSIATLDIIARSSFGHEFYPAGYHAPTADATAIMDSWKEVVASADTFAACCAMPLVRAFPWIARLPFKDLQKAGTTNVVVSRLAHALIATGGEPEGKDLLSRILRAAREGKTSEQLSEQQVVDNIVTYMIAGHETASGVLNFLMLELARKPEVQQRLREEVLSKGGALGYTDVEAGNMPYLDAVIREGLRVYPTAPRTDRYVARDDVIPLRRPVAGLTELVVRRGQVITMSFQSMNLDRSVWGPDAHAFRPERWLARPGGALPGWGGILSFSDGPRNCIGYRLALLELKLILAHMVRAFTFADTGARVHARISPSIQPKVDGKIGMMPIHMGFVRH